jgi:hypothetical protein
MLRSVVAATTVIVAVVAVGFTVVPNEVAMAQEPGAGCRELDGMATSRGPLHTAYPCSRFDAPAANAVLTSTATVLVRGRSSANCEPSGRGAPTYVETVEVQFGPLAGWQPIGFTALNGGCLATWSVVWGPPPLDNQLVTLRARTTAFHGLPTIFTRYTEEPPATLPVRVDTMAPRVTLTAPPFAVGDRFTVVWSASDGAGIRNLDVEYDAGSGWTAWQSGGPGAAQFGPSTPITVQPGQTIRFRARATDGNGLTSAWSAPSDVPIRAGDVRVYLPLSAAQASSARGAGAAVTVDGELP